ncbi:hypothetical protein [Sinomonas sp. P47F7]|uniref:hypothetical protein n=1 Tax=Sinomonas sp. P47F7 TaxID=3410987 RepID=UPI003BF55CDE
MNEAHDHGAVPIGWGQANIDFDALEPGTPMYAWTGGPGIPEIKTVQIDGGGYEVVVVLDGYYHGRELAEGAADHWAKVLSENGLPVWRHSDAPRGKPKDVATEQEIADSRGSMGDGEFREMHGD